jgi:signal transduction histidine kinase/DNA-binding NarL/FixJ family response regulator
VRRAGLLLRGALGLALLALAALLAAPASAEVAVGAAASYPLSRALGYLEDPGRRMTLAEVLRADAQGRFAPVSQGRTESNFGLTRSVYWLRVTLRKQPQAASRWLFEVGYPSLDHIELYQMKDGGWQRQVSGDRYPFGARPAPHRNHVFPIDLPEGAAHTVYLRVQSDGTITVPAKLWQPEALWQFDQAGYTAIAIYFGMLIALALYNFLLYLSLRDNLYLNYVLFVFGMALGQAGLTGFGGQFLWPDLPWWSNVSVTAGMGIAGFFGTLFTRAFLGTPANFKRIDRILVIQATLFALTTFAALMLPYYVSAWMINVVSAVTSVFVVGVGAYALRHGHPGARYFLLGWTMLLVGVGATPLHSFGILPSNLVTTNSLLVGSALEMLLLSFALADRISILLHREESEKARASAEAAANQAKSTFLSNMSHELRSPLNVILGFARLLIREPGLTPSAKNDLGVVVRSGEHLYGLINQILDISKIEAGRTTLDESDFDLRQLLSEIEEMFGLAARQKRLPLVVDCAPDVPRQVRGDAVKLRQVLINLMSNATKFTPAGGVALRVRRIGEARLAFEVTDTGVGIAAHELDQLGRLFVQAQAGRKSREGTGLGLLISRNFVQLMGGELKIASQEGCGTTVSFEVTLKPAAAGAAGDPGVRREYRVIGLEPGQPRYRILVADDRAEARQLLLRLLSGVGIEVREARNGEEAIEQWRQWAPHLILMDMRMPVMDGHEATRRIKALPEGKQTIIVALTASGFESDRARILEDGCEAFMSKPFQEAALFELLERQLGMRFLYDDAPPAPRVERFDGARFALLPPALRERLRDALGDMNVDTIGSAIEQIRRHDAELAAALDTLAADFEYERLLGLIDASERLAA